MLAHVSRIYPFIELPDTLVQDPSKINAPTLVLINVGARLGVLGAPIAVRDQIVRVVATNVAFAWRATTTFFAPARSRRALNIARRSRTQVLIRPK